MSGYLQESARLSNETLDGQADKLVDVLRGADGDGRVPAREVYERTGLESIAAMDRAVRRLAKRGVEVPQDYAMQSGLDAVLACQSGRMRRLRQPKG